MHGVKRDRQQISAELKAQRKEKEKKKLDLYKSVEDTFFSLKAIRNVSVEALDCTSQLLRLNPELYTAWNYRRVVLLSLSGSFSSETSDKGSHLSRTEAPKDFFASARLPEQTAADSEADRVNAADVKKGVLLQEDLDLTLEVLRIHPKVYWIWNHRKWCLEQLPSIDEDHIEKWTREIEMVNKMLTMDPRNFHGWDYRRYILAQIALPRTKAYPGIPTFPESLASDLSENLRAYQLTLAEKEMQYTLGKIEANFSNFSAWHHRSLLLQPIWAAKNLDAGQCRKERDQEFELIRQAIFVDPDDQSVWTYHSWLVHLDPCTEVLEREIASIRELLELEPDSKWCMISLAECLSLLGKSSQRGTAQDTYSTEARSLLERLVTVDPDRKQRYLDLIKEQSATT